MDTSTQSEDKKAAIKTMLNPKSIAVVGARRDSDDNLGAWMDIFGRIAEFGFKGRLYPINPKADMIAGRKAYPNLATLPERVSYARQADLREALPHRQGDAVRDEPHPAAPRVVGR